MNDGTLPPPEPFPLPANEAQRLAALRDYEILDTPPEPAFERITALAARLFQVPVSLVVLADADRLWFKSAYGINRGEIPRADTFCSHAILLDEALVVTDPTKDERFACGPLVVGPPHARFYAGAPLRTSGGHHLGTLCLLDFQTRELDGPGRQLLRDLADVTMDELELRREILRRQRAEADLASSHNRLRMLESAVVNANDAILIAEAEPVDLPGPRILYANHAFERMTGYTEAEVIGKTPRILQGPNTSREACATIRRALERWRPVQVELLNYRKDGTEFWVEISLFPVADERGWFTHWVSVQREVTARRATEEATLAKEAAERANAAKSEFLSRMSHELRTPLNAILGFGQLLEMDALPKRQEESIGHIVRAGRHLLGLVDEVLDIARIEAGEVALAPQRIEVDPFLRETADLVGPMRTQFGITLEVVTPSPPTACVEADLSRLRQILLNLLSNAIKYNRPGGRVTLGCEISESRRLRVTVRDTGPGIAPELLDKLFTPFERLGAEFQAVEGTGLGLTVCKRLTEAMSITLGVESTPGVGSVFWVELPLADPPRDDVHVHGSKVAEPTAQRPATSSGRLLYIEDNASNRTLMSEILTRLRPDWQLLCAANGSDGLAMAAQGSIDLILLDRQLPDFTGEEVLGRLRAQPGGDAVPVVILSADADPAGRDRLLSAGADGYLNKPIDFPALLRTLDEAVAAGGPGRRPSLGV